MSSEANNYSYNGAIIPHTHIANNKKQNKKKV
jgi:hypothetical protein